jgi:L-ascorbate metabolism protein UlaG (beta-lactamase superfamily)
MGSVSAEPLGYVIDAPGRRVYFAGDTGVFPAMASLRPIDLALVPVWGWGPSLGRGHLDPEAAAGALTLLRPRLAVPIHWGTFFPFGLGRLLPRHLTEPPVEFARRSAEVAPEVEVHLLRPGEKLQLDMPVSTAGGR